MCVSQNQTECFGLHLWEPEDDFLREEFNENFKALDDALAAVGRFASGRYTGDGQAERTIELGFTPEAVLVLPSAGNFFANGSPSYTNGGMAVRGFPASKGEGKTLVSICAGGFTVHFVRDYVGTNYNGETFHYAAFG